MKKRIGLTLAVGLVASVASVQAAACLPTTTLAALVALGSTGCTVDDKMFNNFSYSQIGTGAPAATDVAAVLEASLPTLTFGWDIGTPANAFAGNFILQFTVSEIASSTCPGTSCPITDTASQMFPATPPSASATQAFAIVLTAGPSPVTLDNHSLAGNTAVTAFSPVTSLTETVTSIGLSTADPVFDISLRVSESAVPEPATLAFTGAGLLALGLLGRRRKSKS